MRCARSKSPACIDENRRRGGRRSTRREGVRFIAAKLKGPKSRGGSGLEIRELAV
jgi:hypothetical protein